MAKALCIKHGENLDGEVGRESPCERIVLRGALSGRALTSLKEESTQIKGAIDEPSLIGIGGPGVEEPLEGEIDGERGGGLG